MDHSTCRSVTVYLNNFENDFRHKQALFGKPLHIVITEGDLKAMAKRRKVSLMKARAYLRKVAGCKVIVEK